MLVDVYNHQGSSNELGCLSTPFCNLTGCLLRPAYICWDLLLTNLSVLHEDVAVQTKHPALSGGYPPQQLGC